jgi:hypothetical protein
MPRRPARPHTTSQPAPARSVQPTGTASPQVRPSADPLSAAAARPHAGLSGAGPGLSHHAGDRDQLGGYKSYDPTINTAPAGPPGGSRVGAGRPDEAYT